MAPPRRLEEFAAPPVLAGGNASPKVTGVATSVVPARDVDRSGWTPNSGPEPRRLGGENDARRRALEQVKVLGPVP